MEPLFNCWLVGCLVGRFVFELRSDCELPESTSDDDSCRCSLLIKKTYSMGINTIYTQEERVNWAVASNDLS